MIRKSSESLMQSVSIRVALVKSNNWTKYVELVVECLRTRVRFPPTPPLLIMVLSSFNNKPLWNKNVRGFLLSIEIL